MDVLNPSRFDLNENEEPHPKRLKLEIDEITTKILEQDFENLSQNIDNLLEKQKSAYDTHIANLCEKSKENITCDSQLDEIVRRLNVHKIKKDPLEGILLNISIQKSNNYIFNTIISIQNQISSSEKMIKNNNMKIIKLIKSPFIPDYSSFNEMKDLVDDLIDFKNQYNTYTKYRSQFQTNIQNL